MALHAPAHPSMSLTTRVRSLFPALAHSPAFFDNAGGSQLPGVVIDALHAYFTQSFVQTGADYVQSQRASQTVQRAHQFLKLFVNACSDAEAAMPPAAFDAANPPRVELGEVIIGPSTSQLCATLANAYADVLKAGDEIVLCDCAHESNFGPWARLAQRGIVIKRWAIDWDTATSPLAEGGGAGGNKRLHGFKSLLHTSNILGEVVDAKAITKLAHAVGARVVVDGVAYAPHRAIDVADIGCDFYVWSTYKVFGTHAAAMFGKHEALAELTGPNHYFISKFEQPRKFELGGANHESCAAILALEVYLRQLVALSKNDHAALQRATPPAGTHVLDAALPPRRETIVQAYRVMEQLEQPLQDRFIAWLNTRPHLAIVGQAAADNTRSTWADRICTVAFVARDAREGGTTQASSKRFAQALNARGHCVRYGNFYSYRLMESLGLSPTDGVVRASFAHYNTIEEVDALCDAIDELCT
jgi:selenocysteine lyase/cysteine desulfurase